jgi:NAD(P)-dependent dehydrogenase (short-subunit alcohol dehydrogenase family)
MPSQTALIIGASRGLGLGLVQEYLHRGWQVVASVRGAAHTKLHDLVAADGRLEIVAIDINEPAQARAVAANLAGRRFDLLFVNAGVGSDPAQTVADVSTESFIQVMVTNALSPMRMVEIFAPLVTATGSIAVMSSGLGSVAGNDSGGMEVYRASKAALNMFMRSFAARHAGGRRSLLAMMPGWVATDMGGPDAPVDVATSVRGIADTVEAQTDKPGLRFLDYQGQSIPW